MTRVVASENLRHQINSENAKPVTPQCEPGAIDTDSLDAAAAAADNPPLRFPQRRIGPSPAHESERQSGEHPIPRPRPVKWLPTSRLSLSRQTHGWITRINCMTTISTASARKLNSNHNHDHTHTLRSIWASINQCRKRTLALSATRVSNRSGTSWYCV